MMDSDSVLTCSLPSPLVGHQLAYLSIKRSHDFHVPQIMYRLSSQLIQPLQLSIIYHNHFSLSPQDVCLPPALLRLPLGSFSPSRHWQTVKSTISALSFPFPLVLPPLLPAWI